MTDFANSIFDLPGKLLTSDLSNGLSSAMKGAQDLANTTLDKASGTFNSVAKDTLALVDKESLAATTQLTNFIDQQRGLLSQTLDKLKNGSVNLSTIAQAVDFKDGLKVDKDVLLNRVSSALGFPVSSVDGFGDSIKDSLLQKMDSLSNGLVGSVVTSSGGTISLNGQWRENVTNGVLGFLGRISGDDDAVSKVVDNPATSSFFDALMGQTIKVGLFDGIGTIANQYYRDNDAKKAIAKYSYYAVQQADIPTISAIVDQIGSPAMVAKNPDTINSILTGYAFKVGTLASDYPALASELLSTLAKIDPNWWIISFMGEPMVNYAIFQNISPDALLLLRTEERFAAACVLAPNYRTQSQISLVRAQYPLLAIAANQSET